MYYIWDLEGIKVLSISTNRWIGTELWILGYLIYDRETFSETVSWEAKVTTHGWYIVLTRNTGRVGEFQGATFNLPLEISGAARRLL